MNIDVALVRVTTKHPSRALTEDFRTTETLNNFYLLFTCSRPCLKTIKLQASRIGPVSIQVIFDCAISIRAVLCCRIY